AAELRAGFEVPEVAFAGGKREAEAKFADFGAASSDPTVGSGLAFEFSDVGAVTFGDSGGGFFASDVEEREVGRVPGQPDAKTDKDLDFRDRVALPPGCQHRGAPTCVAKGSVAEARGRSVTRK